MHRHFKLGTPPLAFVTLCTLAACGVTPDDTASLDHEDAASAGSGTGLVGQYYSGTAFQKLFTSRTDKYIAFNWGAKPAIGGMPADGFSVRWTGQILPLYSETYTFSTLSDDGVRVWVNGQEIINNWTNHAATTNASTIALEAGQKYDIKVEYYENTGNSQIELWWSSKSQGKQVVPQSQLFPAGASDGGGGAGGGGGGGGSVTPSRGSVPVGSARYAVPTSGAVFVDPVKGNDAAAGGEGAPFKTVNHALTTVGSTVHTVVLRAGTYHESITSSKNFTMQAYPSEAVWFDGSVVVGHWVKRGAAWVSSGWTAQFDNSISFTAGHDEPGWVSPDHPLAADPDMAFEDGTPLTQVASAPKAGQFAVDYAARTLTVGSDPSGHEIRASDLAQAFAISGTVTLRGFGVRRYATPLPLGAALSFGGKAGGERVENLVITQNATQGLSFHTPNCTAEHVSAVNNGMNGFHANNANDIKILDSQANGNNTELFSATGPSDAGIKVTRIHGLVVSNTEVVDNHQCNGLWTDITCYDVMLVNNAVTGAADNQGLRGILTELSDTGVIAGNTVSGYPIAYEALDSGNMKVFNNSLSHTAPNAGANGASLLADEKSAATSVGVMQDGRRNTDAATVAVCPWVTRNIEVANNVFEAAQGAAGEYQFFALDGTTHTAASSMNITVNGNVFSQSSPATMVGWGAGNDTTVTRYTTPQALNSALGKSWQNSFSAADTGIAVALPTDVATALGVSPGTKHLGPFL